MALTFNDTFYLSNNPDVLTAIGRGTFATALQHYNLFGARELRNPNSTFNAREYVLQNDDLVRAFQNGTLLNPFQHFVSFGLNEGRAPSAALFGFDSARYLTANPDVAAAVGAGKAFASAMQHYVLFGAAEGRAAVRGDGTAITATGLNASLTLTTSVDNLVGGATGDLFNAARAVLSGQVLNTLNNSDQVDGGAGTDTLFVQMSEGVDITPAAVRNIEIVSVENMNAGARTLSLQNGDAAVTTVEAANNVAAVTVSNIQSAPSTYRLANTAQNFTASVLASKLSGTADSAALSLTNVATTAPGVTVTLAPTSAGSGYETVAITSLGTATNVITLDDGVGTTLSKITASGANGLTVTATPTTVVTVDGSAMTAAFSFTAAATNNQNMLVTGGTGNDTFNVNGYSTADTVDGGTGTDRLNVANVEATSATATQSNLKSIETIGLTDGANGTISLVNFGAQTLALVLANGGVTTVSAPAGKSGLDFGAVAHTNAITFNVAGVATDDIVSLTVGSATAPSGNNSGALTFNGAETVNVLSRGATGPNTLTSLTLTNTAASEQVIITGDTNLVLETAIVADVVNASGMTGTATLTMNGNANTQSMNITGTANADLLRGGTAADIIIGGAGNDTISNRDAGAASAQDVLTGGAGRDQFALLGDSAGNATNYNGSSFITDFTLTTDAATTEILQLHATRANYTGGGTNQGFAAGVAQAAAGSTAVQSVAQNANAAGYVAGTDLIKLTTAITPTAGNTIQQNFNQAIGSGSVTALGTNTEIFVTYYDQTAGRMVILLADTDAAAGNDTTLGTGDLVTLIGTVTMTAADYANFGANQLRLL